MNELTRVRAVRVSPHLVFALVKQGLVSPVKVVEGLPADAALVGAYHDPERHAFVLLVHAASFDPVPDGQIPPEQLVTFRSTEPHE